MKKLSFLMIIAVLAVIVTVLAPSRVEALPAVQSQFFGMVGIVEGVQAARLNVVNVAPADTRTPRTPCMVELMFFDSDGEMLAMAMVTLDPGKAAFHDFTDSVYEVGRRLQIRAEVMIMGDKVSCNVIPTLEIYDMETMKTEVFMDPVPHL